MTTRAGARDQKLLMLRHSSRMRELDDSTWPFRHGCPSQPDVIESQHPCQSLNHDVTRQGFALIDVAGWATGQYAVLD